MGGLVRVHIAGTVRLQRPGADPAVRSGLPSGCQRLTDQRADLRLAVWFRGEQHPQPNFVIALRTGVGVVRCQRARWRVIPMSAQRNGYRTAESVGVTAWVQHHDSVMGVGRPFHGDGSGGSVGGVVVVVGGSVVVVVVGGVVVVASVVVVVVGGVVVGADVSVTVRVGGGITASDVVVVVVVVVVSDDESEEISCTMP